MAELSTEVLAVNFKTMRHMERVRNLLNVVIVELLKRGELHDQSKLESPEAEAFAQHTDNLAGSDYDSEEYKARKKLLGHALDHHYANNRHHPEHHKNGINDMDIVDLVEMFCDWKAASERHETGNIRKSIEVNARPDKFNMSPQLVRIFENSVNLFS